LGVPPKAWYLAGQIEKESCISLKHSRCWNSRSEFKSAREQGVGLGQLTRAFRIDGSIRFDALQELKDKHPMLLKDLNWTTIKDKPELQIRAVVLKMLDNYKYYARYTDIDNAIIFGMEAYNGGIGGLNNERRACKISGKCNPQYWFNNVENFCLKSKAALYGNRSACDISRNYPRDIIYTRSNKYSKFWLVKN